MNRMSSKLSKLSMCMWFSKAQESVRAVRRGPWCTEKQNKRKVTWTFCSIMAILKGKYQALKGGYSGLVPSYPFRPHINFPIDSCFYFTVAIFLALHEYVKVMGDQECCNCQVLLTTSTTTLNLSGFIQCKLIS